MRYLHVLIALGLVLGGEPSLPFHSASDTALAQAREEMTNADVVRMVSAKLSDAVVIKAIEGANQRRFDLSPTALIELKNAGVSDGVILAMQGAAGAPPVSVAPLTSGGTVDLLQVLSLDQFLVVSVMLRNRTIEEVPIGNRATAEIRLKGGRVVPVAWFVLPNNPLGGAFLSTAVRLLTSPGGQTKLSRTQLNFAKGDTISDVPKNWEPHLSGTRFLTEGIRLEMLFEAPSVPASNVEFVRILNLPPLKVDPTKIVSLADPTSAPSAGNQTTQAEHANTITFDNRSTSLATVKLVGPSNQTVEIPTKGSRMVNIPAGEYYILVRYGTAPGPFSYTRGDTFVVRETSETVSAVTITLHQVVGGNYGSRRTSREEFDSANAATTGTDARDSKPPAISTSPSVGASSQTNAQVKPDFTGRWEIDSSQSTSTIVRGKNAPAGPPRVELYPEIIEHKEPAFETTNDLSDPKRRTVSATTTDGKEYRQKVSDQQTYVSRTFWEGAKLITEWRLEHEGSILIDGRDSRSLSGDRLVQIVDRHLKFGLGNETSHHTVMVRRP